jgi:hypothetical protein
MKSKKRMTAHTVTYARDAMAEGAISVDIEDLFPMSICTTPNRSTSIEASRPTLIETTISTKKKKSMMTPIAILANDAGGLDALFVGKWAILGIAMPFSLALRISIEAYPRRFTRVS